MDDVLAPSTPAFSAVDFDVPSSDHGKEEAQQKWIRLMQMTPNQLRFLKQVQLLVRICGICAVIKIIKDYPFNHLVFC